MPCTAASGALRVFPNTGRHGQEIRRRLRSTAGALATVMPPIATHGHHHGFAPARSSSISAWVLGSLVGWGRKRRRRHSRRPPRRFHRQLAAIVAGDAHYAATRPIRGARCRHKSLFLADMHPVAAQFGGELGPVVEDKGRACRLHHGTQQIGGAADRIVFRPASGAAGSWRHRRRTRLRATA